MKPATRVPEFQKMIMMTLFGINVIMPFDKGLLS